MRALTWTWSRRRRSEVEKAARGGNLGLLLGGGFRPLARHGCLIGRCGWGGLRLDRVPLRLAGLVLALTGHKKPLALVRRLAGISLS